MAPTKAPVTEKGTVRTDLGIPTWNSIGASQPDEREDVRELRFPASVRTFERMENDGQLNGLLLGTMLPIRRFRWELDPNGARSEIVQHVASDLNVPIRGEDPGPVPRRRGRFSWDTHLRTALRALVYGFYPFEQVAPIADDGRAHLRKLAPRPPRTISEISVAKDGGLEGVKQSLGWGSPMLEINRLVFYCWGQDGANWYGRSVLRPCYRNWLIKDRLLRVDAMRHERNGMGVPWFETDPNLTQPQVDELAATASRFRAGEEAGGAGPGKFSLKGVDGSLSDIVASWKMHNAEMAKNFLMMFFELGQSDTGARALGESFIDFFAYSQEAIADWIADTFNEHVIEDLVDWNWNAEELTPRLVYRREEEHEYAANDLATLVKAGAIEVDDELEDVIRERGGLPARSAPRASASQPGPTPPPVNTARSKVADQLLRAARQPMSWPELARATGRTPKDGTARRARDELLDSGRLRQETGGRLVATAEAPLALPDRELRRQPYDFEITAAVDFAAMEDLVVSQRTSLVEALKKAQGAQVDAVVTAIEDAAGDIGKLAALTVEPIDTEVVASPMRTAAKQGYAAAESEAKAQGVQTTVRTAAGEETDKQIDARAEAISLGLAGALRETASRKALSLSGGALGADEVAGQVREHLGSLSDAFLTEQANGAVMEGMNSGRKDFMRQSKPGAVYASELLDANTCGSCASEDGTQWGTVEEAEQSYPMGGYVGCEGGLRCRGSLVGVYGGV